MEQSITDYPEISQNPAVQALYVCMRLRGESHTVAEMLALRQPPMSDTDREFLEGHCNGNQFSGNPWIGEMYRREALAEGVDPKGKVYLAGLARFPGDPQAWVDGKGDVRRRLEERGWGAVGAVNVEPEDRSGPRVAPAVADDLVQREVQKVLAEIPSGDRPGVNVQDLKEQIVDARKPHWSD